MACAAAAGGTAAAMNGTGPGKRLAKTTKGGRRSERADETPAQEADHPGGKGHMRGSRHLCRDHVLGDNDGDREWRRDRSAVPGSHATRRGGDGAGAVHGLPGPGRSRRMGRRAVPGGKKEET